MGIVLSIASSMFYTTCHWTMQFILFLLVDYIVKASLTNSRSVSERRRLWQIEGSVLAVLSIIFFIVDRFPIIVFLLACLSLLSSVPHGQEVVKSFQVYFQGLFITARTKFKRWFSNDTAADYPDDGTNQNYGEERYGEPHPMSSSYKPSTLARPSIRGDATPVSHYPQHQFLEQEINSSVRPAGLNQTTPFKRANEQQKTPVKPSKQPQQSSATPTSWKSQIMSFIGYGGVPSSPPGLRNRGQNLCFMNSVVQCLSHLPNIFPPLSREIPQASKLCNALESSFLKEFCNLLVGCASTPVGSIQTTVDTYGFRKAAAQLGSATQIVAHPGYNQTQQDASEFLMWILSTLHDILQKVPTASNQPHTQVGSNLDSMSPENLKALKMKLFHQLESQDSMYDDASVTAVRTLSDMEWYELNNDKRSFVTDMFAGQLLELYENQTNNRVAVGIQLFQVLPIPLCEPRVISGIVQLQDCINSLSSIDHDLPEGSTMLTSAFFSGGKKADIACPPLSPPMYSSTPGRDQSPNNSSSNEVRYQTTIRFPPLYLILQLNRFTYNNGRIKKIRTPVNIPLMDLDLSSTLFEQHFSVHTPGKAHGPLYDLQGLCIHEGGESTENGHYVSYCRASDRQWYKFDDEVVNKVNMTYECCTQSIRRNSYLLFYARKDV